MENDERERRRMALREGVYNPFLFNWVDPVGNTGLLSMSLFEVRLLQLRLLNVDVFNREEGRGER